MGHWTPTGVEPKDYDDDDDENYVEHCRGVHPKQKSSSKPI